MNGSKAATEALPADQAAEDELLGPPKPRSHEAPNITCGMLARRAS